jgi:hypothetical protein
MSKRLGISFLFLATSIFCPELARADTLDLVTQSGTWGTTCPPVVCSQPGDSWNYSFLSNSTLVPDNQCCWDSPMTDFEFDLNGQPVAALDGLYTQVRFFPGSNDGGFDFGACCTNAIAFNFWVQLFSPFPFVEATLIPGVYPVNIPPPSSPGTAESVFGGCYGCVGPSQQPGFHAGPVVITPVPEPSTSGLTLIGIALLLLMRKKMLLSPKIPL